MVAPTLALVAYLKKICLPFWNMKTYRQILLTGLVIAASTEKFHFVYSPSRNFSWNYIQKLLKKINTKQVGAVEKIEQDWDPRYWKFPDLRNCLRENCYFFICQWMSFWNEGVLIKDTVGHFLWKDMKEYLSLAKWRRIIFYFKTRFYWTRTSSNSIFWRNLQASQLSDGHDQ